MQFINIQINVSYVGQIFFFLCKINYVQIWGMSNQKIYIIFSNVFLIPQHTLIKEIGISNIAIINVIFNTINPCHFIVHILYDFFIYVKTNIVTLKTLTLKKGCSTTSKQF